MELPPCRPQTGTFSVTDLLDDGSTHKLLLVELLNCGIITLWNFLSHYRYYQLYLISDPYSQENDFVFYHRYYQ